MWGFGAFGFGWFAWFGVLLFSCDVCVWLLLFCLVLCCLGCLELADFALIVLMFVFAYAFDCLFDFVVCCFWF